MTEWQIPPDAAAAELLWNIFAPPQHDGPPYTHTLVHEEPPHVVYCRGCQHAWMEAPAPSLRDLALGLAAPGDSCTCTCTDDTDPRYEDWVTDPPAEDIPPGAWES